jgi:hypothetical protein
LLKFLVFSSCSIGSETDPNTVMKMASKDNTKELGEQTNAKDLVDPVVNVKVKLAVMWCTLMFFYIYNDILTLFQQEVIEGLLAGNLEGVEFTPTVLFAAAALMSFPIFMVLLSVMLPARTNRRVNLFAGVFHLVLLVATLGVGEGPMAFYAMVMAFEGVVIAAITWTAWRWPTTDGAPLGAPRPDGAELGI